MTIAMSDEAYREHWIARIKSSCLVNERGCWIWQGHTFKNGYGMTCYRRDTVPVHRQMFKLLKGPLDRWEYACHSCDTKACCNPDHLWKGTPLDNQVDSVMKGRNGEQQVTHCPRGHAYEGDNIVWKVAASGRPARDCVICTRKRDKVRKLMRQGIPREQAWKQVLGGNL